MRLSWKLPHRKDTVVLYKIWKHSYQIQSILGDRWTNSPIKGLMLFIGLYFKCLLILKKPKKNLLWTRSEVCETILEEKSDGTVFRRSYCPGEVIQDFTKEEWFKKEYPTFLRLEHKTTWPKSMEKLNIENGNSI